MANLNQLKIQEIYWGVLQLIAMISFRVVTSRMLSSIKYRSRLHCEQRSPTFNI
jgi:hypothetical protein